eukprot:CAMPEP_0184855144 /NCGR_PEP_ID=MMETSP0580-20130426/466_1 /TAXON_ID=1118495 /ORGANISM="Dactyliosolen fragilissimus" /LENGTH=78 /DNA_ID=CAMNT_0027349585 /DNA_START=358 /DNA_END=594 /DNA_ORIENTATION=+
MGNCLAQRRSAHHLSHLDDSVRVMMKHDRKVAREKGMKSPSSYKPRTPNPALQRVKDQHAQQIDENGSKNGTISCEED